MENNYKEYRDKFYNKAINGKFAVDNKTISVNFDAIWKEIESILQEDREKLVEKIKKLMKDCLYEVSRSGIENQIKVERENSYNQAIKDIVNLIKGE